MKICCVLLAAMQLLPAFSTRAAEHPNFVIILGDAQGWASMSEPLDDRNVKGSKNGHTLQAR